MKKILFRLVLLTLFAVMCSGNVNVEAKTTPHKKVKYHNRFVKDKQGNRYYYNGKGKKLKNRFFTTKTGNTYYFSKTGKAFVGWKKIKNDYYFFTNAGVMKKDCEVDGIILRKNGKMVDNSYNIEKINTIKKAEKIVEQITNKEDDKEVKLKKCYDWIISFPYCQYRKMSEVKNLNWETIFANDIFNNGRGCCVSESAAFAFMARACGYKEVYVCTDTAHGWTEIDGYVYDPLFSEAKNYSKYYHCTYNNYGLWAAGGRVKV